jgi:azurin
MTAQQLHDVVRFLSSLGTGHAPDPQLVDTVLSHSLSHAPAQFPFDLRPLQPDIYPHHHHDVNRDRIYDFYTKQAEYFRKADFRPPLLAEYPGLDGGTLGHWGNQNEETWANDDWSRTDHGRLLSGVTRGNGITVTRGICVRLGDDMEVAACFDPDTLTWAAAWTGGFVGISSVRHGFLGGLTIQGKPLELPEQRTPGESFRYQGLYRHGDRIVFAYRIGDIDYLDAPWVEDGQFTHVVARANEHPLRRLTKPGSLRWPESFTTKVTSVAGDRLIVDSIELPVDNPWNVPVYPGDHDFLPDGSVLVCTMQGDVWHATGLNEISGEPTVQWRRFASGLHQPLGLVIDGDGIFVLCRDQIVCLHDLNQDGEADFHECFSNAFESSLAGHDFVCGLQRDDRGRFYTASGNQGLVRIAADGKTAEVLAVGFRNPDGLGLHPDGMVTIPCSEGSWTPASQICAVRPNHRVQTTAENGRIGHHHPPHFGLGGAPGHGAPDLPLVYLPRGLDNSAGGQCVIQSDKWGPLNGQMMHTSFGTGTHCVLLRDEVDGQLQGGVVPLEGEFLSGAHRARFNPTDGHLYVSGMTGWGTYTPEPGCFHRVRRTDAPLKLPTAFHVHQNGIALEFSEPLEVATAENVERHFAQCWNYRFSPAYGSAEYSAVHTGMTGHDMLAIRSAHVSHRGHQLFLEIPELQPVNQLHLRLNAYDDQGTDLFLTVHRLDGPYTDFDGYQPVSKDVAPHPMLADITLIRNRVPNPFQQQLPSARNIVLETATNLSFATRRISARAGEAIHLTLKNPDVVPHNWALLKPGTLPLVGGLANKMVADPAGWARHYIPRTDKVLVYTDIVPAKQEFSVYFTVPQEPGSYPFLCTFPGHWMVMNGELIVE